MARAAGPEGRPSRRTRLVDRLRRALSGITPAGRAAFLLAAGALLLGHYAGYTEFFLVAAVLALLILVSLTFTALPTVVRAELDLSPAHTVAGETSRAVLAVTNLRRIRMYHPLVMVPVSDPHAVAVAPLTRRARRRASAGARGRASGRRSHATVARVPVRLPVLRYDEEHRVPFAVPAPRRGVLQVGPVGARRTDPLGFFWRHASWTTPVELLVRPRMASVESIGAGYVHDLEGTPSDQVSMSDLSFHALREYVRGDDLRHVHWRSSARTGSLYVRQYHDTRRSHAVVFIDDAIDSYADADEFELALSMAASVVARAALDAYDLTLVCGSARLSGTADSVLDALCRIAWSPEGDLAAAATAARQVTAGASALIVASGSRMESQTLERVRGDFAGDVRLLGLRADANQTAEVWPRPDVVTVAELDQLPAALTAYVEQAVG